MPFKFASNLELPDNAATQTFAWLGIKGSGKSYGAMKLAELLASEGKQIVALDPVGIWYGLRLNAAGTGPSKLKLPVLGGLRGDVPLDYRAGKTVANFLADTGSSAILDVSLFRKGQRKEFVVDLAEELFHRAKGVRRPLHLFLEEAQVFAPQHIARGEERMLGAIEDIVRIGRNFGLGVSMITQRPQSVNKEVLNQAEPLIVFRIIAKHERDAIEGWMKHAGVEAGGMVAELHSLKTGECWLWSPAWLETFAKTKALKRVTYDASSTPTGAEGPATVELKPVDLGKLEQAMAKSIEEAKANDPKALRAKIAELERALAKPPAAPAIDEAEIARRVDAAVESVDRAWRRHVAAYNPGTIAAAAQNTLDAIALGPADLPDFANKKGADRYKNQGSGDKQAPAVNIAAPIRDNPPRVQQRPTERRGQPAAFTSGDNSLSAMERKFLTALAMKDAGRSKQELLVFTGYTACGAVSKVFAKFTDEGLWEKRGDAFVLTVAGGDRLGAWDPLPTGARLRDERVKAASGMEAKFLQEIFLAYPQSITKKQLLELTGYTPCGAVSKVFARLNRLNWATSDRGALRANAVFFEE